MIYDQKLFLNSRPVIEDWPTQTNLAVDTQSQSGSPNLIKGDNLIAFLLCILLPSFYAAVGGRFGGPMKSPLEIYNTRHSPYQNNFEIELTYWGSRFYSCFPYVWNIRINFRLWLKIFHFKHEMGQSWIRLLSLSHFPCKLAHCKSTTRSNQWSSLIAAIYFPPI